MLTLARVTVWLSLVALSSAQLGNAFYRRWSDTRFLGNAVLSTKVDTALQCGAACQSHGAECSLFSIQHSGDGIICELTNSVYSKEDAPGINSYYTSDFRTQLISDLGFVDVGNGEYYKYVVPGGSTWYQARDECTEIFGTLFEPTSKAEFWAVQNYKDANDISGVFWVGLKHDENYPSDIYNLEGHARDNTKLCMTMLNTHDHMHYEECGSTGFDGKICKLNFPM